MGQASSLRCSRCNAEHAAGQPANLCHCGGPLLVQYDLDSVRASWSRDQLASAPASMWRYHPILPAEPAEAVSVPEGWTPLLPAERLGSDLGFTKLFIKDEGRNPGQSFKARGMSCAVTMARRFGLKELAAPSAGNAGGALALYAALAGMKAHIFLPSDVPRANRLECQAHGAEVTLVDGTIADCGRIVAQRAPIEGWFDVSTLKEPYRIEGKKTMGYEIAEQFGWTVPDVILYPCGGGVGLIGIWKAMDELQQLGWIGQKRPRMVAVQAEGCAPIVAAWKAGTSESHAWPHPYTVASGLRVPKPLGDALVLRALRESNGTALAVTDREMVDGALRMARLEGIWAAPEGGACVAALPHLRAAGLIDAHEKILILNTGSGVKYAEAFAARYGRHGAGEQDKLGGLITPR